MNVETIRQYCLSLPLATEDTAFGEDYLLLRVCGHIFAALDLERADGYLILKCDPDYAIDLRDRYAEIEPAWHWNKRYWNQLPFHNHLPDALLQSLVRHSYAEVVKKFTQKLRREHPEITAVTSPSAGRS
jgi:predicted DNA-binding protein (MmcQ/YjbR family)